jgi:hypothetical protein
VAAARDRVADYDGADVIQLAVPGAWPDGRFDLIVLSEVGYYLSAADLDLLVTRCVGSLEPGGSLVAVHWRHPVADYPLRGDDVHAAIGGRPELHRLVRQEEADLLLEVFETDPARSVAERSGLWP